MSILPFLDIGMKILDKVIPDPEQKAKAQLELMRLQQEGDSKLLDAATQMSVAQSATNTAEAANSNIFVAGWRPFLGWVCGAAFAYNYLAYPLLLWCAAYYNPAFKPPVLAENNLMELVMGMLGLAGLRTFERVRR